MAVTEFEIDRAKWLTGELLTRGQEQVSRLLSAKGNRCCLGFYAQACGLADSQIKSHYTPVDLHHEYRLPDEMRWLVRVIEPYDDEDEDEDDNALAAEGSRAADLLIDGNDDPELSREDREQRIAQLFWKEREIRVTFTGTYPF